MKTELVNALNDAKSFGRLFRAMSTVADELEHVSNIDQAANEAQMRLDKTQQNVDSINVVLNTARQQLQDTDALIDAAKAKADGIVADATAKAAEITTAASRQAGSIIDAANQRASTIDATIADKQATLNTLLSDIETAQHNHETLKTHIETTKAQLRVLAG